MEDFIDALKDFTPDFSYLDSLKNKKDLSFVDEMYLFHVSTAYNFLRKFFKGD